MKFMTQLSDKEHNVQMEDMASFDELSELLEQEFSLPYFEFVYAECPPIELGGTASA